MDPLFDSPRWRHVRYAVATGACAFALLSQLLIWSDMPPSPPLLFYPAVLVAAWFGGFGPAVFAVLLSSISMAYWFLPPPSSLERVADVLDMAVFIALSLTMAALMARARAATQAADWACREAEKAREGLQQAFRAREEMLAIVSHDLRTPLTSIELSSAQMMRSSTLSKDERVRLYGRRIQRAARRMESLVRNLLDASAIEAGTLSMRFSPVHVDVILETTTHLCQPLAERRSIVLEAGSEVDLLLVCDGDRIQQALESVVGNALKLLPAEGEVVLSVRTRESEVVFEVRDSGPGIPPDQIGRVFDRHWRGGGGASTGLGLYVAKAIVEGHGGRIWATSGNGKKGTTVAFALPVGGLAQCGREITDVRPAVQHSTPRPAQVGARLR